MKKHLQPSLPLPFRDLVNLSQLTMILNVVLVERCFQYSETKTFAKSRFRLRILLLPPLSIINTEYWTAVKLDLLAEIENILFSLKHLLYKYKLIFSFYLRFLTFLENSKKVSTLFVISKIFVKFKSVYIWQVDIGNTILSSNLDKITWYFKYFPHQKSLMKNSKVHNYVTWRPEGGSGLTFRKNISF